PPAEPGATRALGPDDRDRAGDPAARSLPLPPAYRQPRCDLAGAGSGIRTVQTLHHLQLDRYHRQPQWLALRGRYRQCPAAGRSRRRRRPARLDAVARDALHLLGQPTAWAQKPAHAVTYFLSERGNFNRYRNPSPGALSAVTVPPSAPVTRLYRMCAPSPLPPSPRLVVKKGSKSLPSDSWSMPAPSSAYSKATCSPSCAA